MKLTNLSGCIVIASLALPLCSGYGQTPAAPAPAATAVVAAKLSPPVADVVRLSSAGMGEDVVLAFVKNSRSLFRLSADDIVQLKDSGVSPTVITAMLTHDTAPQNPVPPEQPGYNYSQRNYGDPSAPATSFQVSQPAPQPEVASNPDAVATQPQSQPAPAQTVVVQPAPQVEYVPVSPGPGYYWAPGYWGWDNGWCWNGGRWTIGVGFGWGWGGGYRGGWGGYHGGYRGGGGFRGGGGGRFHGGHH